MRRITSWIPDTVPVITVQKSDVRPTDDPVATLRFVEPHRAHMDNIDLLIASKLDLRLDRDDLERLLFQAETALREYDALTGRS